MSAMASSLMSGLSGYSFPDLSGNLIMDAAVSASAVGPTIVDPATTAGGIIGGLPLVPDVHITGRTSDKFAMGFLGGCGGASQFQGVSCLLPVLPPASNRDTEWRNAESRGLTTGEHLMPRWGRPNNFNPGLGTDTWRNGVNVTWTLANRGLQDPTTGLMGPLAYPARPCDAVGRNPIGPFEPRRQGLAANITPPAVLVGSTSGYQAGLTMGQMQSMAQRAFARRQKR